jgi:DNA polymerase-3 subunit epsilon
MRQIVLDTETTGFNIAEGNRIIEIGCIEIQNRRLTGNNFHVYLNPQRDSEEGALAVHGLTTEFLSDKPLFPHIVNDFLAYIKGAELIIHNAAFDIGFLNNEFKLADKTIGTINNFCTVVDTLALARNIFPGQRNTLDALCKRYEVDNSERTFHGALLDAHLLAQVYLLMTGGQRGLEWDGSGSDASGNANAEPVRKTGITHLPVLFASDEDLALHDSYLKLLDKKSNGKCLWLQQLNS